MKFVLALDIGTTSVKAGLFDSEGICRCTALEEYKLVTHKSDQVELDAESYWAASIATITRAISESSINPADIVGIAVSSQGETLIAVDKLGKPVRNAIVWMDNRATEQAEVLKEVLGEQVYERTGIPEVVPTWPACKILWLKQHEPENFSKAYKFLLVQDYLIFCLSGNYLTDGSISCTTLLYDIIEQEWWKAALEAVGITQQQLPDLLPVGAIAGTLTQQAAAYLGLPPDVKVVCGGMDQSVGAIGAGNIDEGMASETTGAALAIQVSIRNPMIDPSRTTPVYMHSVPGKYLFVPVCPTAGMAYKWFKENFVVPEGLPFTEVNDAYEFMNALADQVPPGCDGLVMLPHLMGAFSPVSNPFARGSFTGFTLLHGKGHFIRAIQEAVAFLLRQNIEAVQRTGQSIKEIRTSGGGSRSHLWNQIKADVCAIPIHKLANADASLVGGAVLAGVACGLYESINAACEVMVQITEVVNPSVNSEVYEKYYKRFLELDLVLQDYYRKNYSN